MPIPFLSRESPNLAIVDWCLIASKEVSIGEYIYGGRFRAVLTYFPSISHLFLHYFPKTFPFPNYFSVISRLFHSYFSFLNNFSLISQIFPNYFSFPDDASHFSVTLPNYFSVISQFLLNYFPVKVRIFPLYITG